MKLPINQDLYVGRDLVQHDPQVSILCVFTVKPRWVVSGITGRWYPSEVGSRIKVVPVSDFAEMLGIAVEPGQLLKLRLYAQVGLLEYNRSPETIDEHSADS